uniref:Uncharacterized protein n=1 Tax=Knipowitschia caucasica TaxID=637954 RepID=A0AAV2MFY6_KNICA
MCSPPGCPSSFSPCVSALEAAFPAQTRRALATLTALPAHRLSCSFPRTNCSPNNRKKHPKHAVYLSTPRGIPG